MFIPHVKFVAKPLRPVAANAPDHHKVEVQLLILETTFKAFKVCRVEDENNAERRTAWLPRSQVSAIPLGGLIGAPWRAHEVLIPVWLYRKFYEQLKSDLPVAHA